MTRTPRATPPEHRRKAGTTHSRARPTSAAAQAAAADPRRRTWPVRKAAQGRRGSTQRRLPAAAAGAQRRRCCERADRGEYAAQTPSPRRTRTQARRQGEANGSPRNCANGEAHRRSHSAAAQPASARNGQDGSQSQRKRKPRAAPHPRRRRAPAVATRAAAKARLRSTGSARLLSAAERLRSWCAGRLASTRPLPGSDSASMRWTLTRLIRFGRIKLAHAGSIAGQIDSHARAGRRWPLLSCWVRLRSGCWCAWSGCWCRAMTRPWFRRVAVARQRRTVRAAVSIAKWHLFGNRRYAGPRSAMRRRRRLRCTLRGTVADRRSAHTGIAVISDAQGREQTYRVGDEIETGVKLARVYPDHVVLSHDGVRGNPEASVRRSAIWHRVDIVRPRRRQRRRAALRRARSSRSATHRRSSSRATATTRSTDWQQDDESGCGEKPDAAEAESRNARFSQDGTRARRAG